MPNQATFCLIHVPVFTYGFEAYTPLKVARETGQTTSLLVTWAPMYRPLSQQQFHMCDRYNATSDHGKNGKNKRKSNGKSSTREQGIPTFHLALPHQSSYSLYGLGYDFATDDYKVVTLSRYQGGHVDTTFVDVYSAKVGLWRRLESLPYDDVLTERP
ncbi:hypothetical protein HAX54_050593 [Datura stramonium]|uniref:Uncharacterized protein n=1 Tax=Datura stramonium TaxID=4076 RepID=A0ABS8WQG7_DATST|nr:hypothetical protein [Datura stramonium]